MLGTFKPCNYVAQCHLLGAKNAVFIACIQARDRFLDIIKSNLLGLANGTRGIHLKGRGWKGEARKDLSVRQLSDNFHP